MWMDGRWQTRGETTSELWPTRRAERWRPAGARFFRQVACGACLSSSVQPPLPVGPSAELEKRSRAALSRLSIYLFFPVSCLLSELLSDLAVYPVYLSSCVVLNLHLFCPSLVSLHQGPRNLKRNATLDIERLHARKLCTRGPDLRGTSDIVYSFYHYRDSSRVRRSVK